MPNRIFMEGPLVPVPRSLQGQVKIREQAQRDADDAVQVEEGDVQPRQVILRKDRMLVREHRDAEAEAGQVPSSEPETMISQQEKGRHGDVKRPRHPKRIPDSEVAGDGVEPRRTVELDVLKRI